MWSKAARALLARSRSKDEPDIGQADPQSSSVPTSLRDRCGETRLCRLCLFLRNHDIFFMTITPSSRNLPFIAKSSPLLAVAYLFLALDCGNPWGMGRTYRCEVSTDSLITVTATEGLTEP